jgi:hypothetical protein
MTNGNGHKTREEQAKEIAFEGATVSLESLIRRDGMIAESLDKGQAQRLGVIQRSITAVNSDDEYRQILKLGRWRSQEHLDKTLNAIAACRTCGAKKALKFILDKITAESAGLNGEALREAFDALTHTSTTYDWRTSNYKGKNGNRDASSPITQ